MKTGDTIAAISTPPGRGGIGVVRLSGPQSLELASRIFLCPSANTPQPARAYFGNVIGDDPNETLDTAVLTYFKGPHSYTGEDVAEVSCHGSPVVLGAVLNRLLRLGARAAEPGEFTMRAFLNRRLDLAQAQGVRDLIDAQTVYQAKLATSQMQGSLSKRIAPHKQAVIDVVVHLESSLEFVEDDISPESAAGLIAKLDSAIAALSDIAGTFSFGKFVKQGFNLAIVGRPNVGKSSIFNRLIGTDRAIVTSIPGTTRDALYETTSIAGIPVRLIDTAGIRETSDTVETIGISRSRAAIADADTTLLVLDASEPSTADDVLLLKEIPEDSRIVILNKADLPRRISLGEKLNNGSVSVSAITGAGFDDLIRVMIDRLHGAAFAERDDMLITDARQHHSLERGIEELREALRLLSDHELEEIVLLKLRKALASIGEISGETLTDDILNQIFSTFCIGK
ncbi:MAG: tRNA uridine-5-carboxymethylaminomethyl(34) synthesis GTPase MnmE [Blastocatellia bacterium]